MEKVAEAASASGPATNDSNKRRSAALSRAGAGAMSAATLLFTWLAVGTLRRCAAMDEEEVFSGVLWGLSPLICAYLFCWTVVLSPAPQSMAGAGAVFARAAWLLLVAVAADKLIAPVAGATALILAPLLSACACGSALAERRQRAGTERWSAATVASSTPIYQSRAEEQDVQDNKAAFAFAFSLMALVVLASVLFALWVGDTPVTELDWEAPPTGVVFFLAGPFLLLVRLMPLCMVGCPVLDAIDDMRFIAALIGVIGWLVVAVLAGALYGMMAGAVVFWIGELGVLGFLGYFLAVEAHYKQLVVIERGKPRRAKDASGLLDGRDSGDACSARINAAAGICVDCVSSTRCKCTSCRSQLIR